MAPVLPAMNTTWFWFDQKDRRKLHGTPLDVMRKFELISSSDNTLQGLEIFLIPKMIENVDQFPTSFYQKFSKLNYKSVHIGDTDQDFLCKTESIAEQLELLAIMLDRFETDILVLHAHHFKEQRKKIRSFLLSIFPKVKICVENNGFDNQWGASIDSLTQIFSDCPEFKFCLDIAHVKDFSHQYQLKDFISHDLLRTRIHEIHYSFSTFHCESDPYEGRGYPGYGPYHALFSVLGKTPSSHTKEFVMKYPVIIEGIIPREDKYLNFLKQEANFLLQ